MALIKCSECGKEISDKAASCPHCGCPVSVASENFSLPRQHKQKKDKCPKTSKPKAKKILLGLLCVVIVIFAIFFIRSNFSRYDWDDVKLSSLLPEPKSSWGNLSSNREDYLSLSVHRFTAEDYIEYVSACVNMGFSIDPEQEDNSYSAYNEAGYELDLYYIASDKKLRINIDAPMEMGTIEWPDSEIAKLLPIPNSTEGKIKRDDEQGFEVYLKNISKTDLDAYISECKEAGFIHNYEKKDDFYYAQNADGYQFTAEYNGCNVVFLSIIEPQKTLELQFVATNSQCDVEVRIDDSYECTVDHGESETRTVKLGLGKHTIRVENDDDDEIYDYYEINVTEDGYIKFEVRCTKDSIQIGLFGELKDNQEPANNASSDGTGSDKTDNNLTLTTKAVDEQFSAIQAILSADSCDEILSKFSDSSTSDSGNIFCDGYFCDIDGTYEILCWENKPYQLSFMWESSANVDIDGIVSKLNATLGEYVRNYEYWGIYEWEKDNIEISVDPEDGVCIEMVFDGGKSKCAIDTASVDRSIYMMLSEEEVDYDIGVIKTLMSYCNKPKYTIYEKYPNLVDDDWNQLQMTGTMFGIDGRYCIMYDRETGLISEIGFDWIPDDRETHDNHVVYCLELYFGECTETDQFYYDKTYYEHDWRRTTLDNWSVHLSTTKDSGWLQIWQMADYVPDDDDLPEERPEANDYDEFIDVITACFRYIPDCELSFGSEDTGSSNSYAIHADGDIVGIFGIELDSFDMVSMIDPDKDNADLYHEQMAVAMIMCLDSDMSYEDAKEIFEASKGDSTLFGSGIFCSEGMDSGMKAFGIDITWLS